MRHHTRERLEALLERALCIADYAQAHNATEVEDGAVDFCIYGCSGKGGKHEDDCFVGMSLAFLEDEEAEEEGGEAP